MKKVKVNCVRLQLNIWCSCKSDYGWSTLVSSACSRGSDLQVEDGVLCCVAAWMGGKVRCIRVRVDSNEEEIGTC